jgi:hypothetical protein
MNREEMVQLVEDAYFGNVAAGRLSEALDCFCEGARVTIRHGDLPPRVFVKRDNDGTLQDFLGHLTAHYDAWFGEFEHYVDVDAQRIASRFVVRLTTRKPDEHPSAQLLNCNFFDLEDGRIRNMIIYYTNPGAGENGYTGYPAES